MTGPLYISFFTARYAESAGELRKTLDTFGLDHELTHLANAGDDWVKNVQHKPRHIAAAMARHPNRPVVWVDADARIRRRPELFEKWARAIEEDKPAPDFAAHWLGGLELLSGTLWFAPTTAAATLASKWINHQANHLDMVDQVSLERVLTGSPRNMPEWLRVSLLPASYVAIFDHQMTEPKDRVIEHLQHSRKHRHVPCGVN